MAAIFGTERRMLIGACTYDEGIQMAKLADERVCMVDNVLLVPAAVS